jgi:hypothetical protein
MADQIADQRNVGQQEQAPRVIGVATIGRRVTARCRASAGRFHRARGCLRRRRIGRSGLAGRRRWGGAGNGSAAPNSEPPPTSRRSAATRTRTPHGGQTNQRSVICEQKVPSCRKKSFEKKRAVGVLSRTRGRIPARPLANRGMRGTHARYQRAREPARQARAKPRRR